MSTSSTYYLNGPSLGTATAVFSNSELSVCAPDGFYSDGVIVREQVGCILLPRQVCPSCATPCGGAINASGQQGIYYLSIDLGSGTGAVVVTFNPQSVPDGISASYDSVVYNGLSSPNYGWLQGTLGLPTYIGATGADCGIVASSPYLLNEFEYDGTSFQSLGTTTTVSVDSGQMQLTTSGPGNSVMVIPKVVASPSILNLTFIGPCAGTVFNIGVSCPELLTSFASSQVAVTNGEACGFAVDQTYYVAHVNGAAGTLGLYDLVYTDPIGQFKLDAGFYKTTAAGANEWYQVDSNGVIIDFGVCGATLNVTSVFGYMEPCTGGAIDDYMGATVTIDGPATASTQFIVEVSYVDAGGTCGGTTFTETFSVQIPEGDTISNFNACSQGTYFPSGAVVCGACIISCDNINISISGFECPV